MSELFGREWALEVSRAGRGLRYENLDMRFSAKQNSLSKPTICDITIWNPDPGLLGSITSEGALIRALAGYSAQGATEIAQGVVVSNSVSDRSKSADPMVSFQISKGREIFNNVILSKTFTSVSAEELIEYIRSELGVAYDIVELAKKPYYNRGFTLSGSPANALSTIVEDCGCQYTLVDGRLRIWPKNSFAKRLVDIWAANTGLLECFPQGNGKLKKIACSVLLRPSARPGDIVEIESPQYNGMIRIDEVAHDCDTTSDLWQTTAIGVPYVEG